MSNLWEDIDLFELEDEEGIFLSAGETIRVWEPDGMDQAMIDLLRSKYHGLDFEFFDAESPIAFDHVKIEGETLSGYDLIEEIFNVRGTDSKITFRYYRSDTPNLIYESKLIFSSKVKMDYAIKMRARRVDFDDDFKNRSGTPYDLNRTVDLNGDPISPAVYEDIILPPQVVVRELVTIKGDTSEIDASSTPSRFANINFGEQIGSSFKGGFVSYETQIGKPDSINFTFEEFGYYNFLFEFDISYRFNSAAGLMDLKAELYDPYRQEENEFILWRLIGPGGAGSTANVQVSDSELGVWANKGFTLKVFLDTGSTGGSGLFDIIESRETKFNIVGETKSGFLATKYVELKSALVKLLQGITGYANPLNSTFLDLQNAGLLSGGLVRGRPETEPFNLKWDDCIKSLEAIFGLGFSVTSESGDSVINLSPLSDFYQDKEILSITEGVKDFEVEIDLDFIYNELDIGYESFARGNDTAILAASNNDFLTKHSYLSAIKRDKRKKTLISKWVTSGHVITEGKQQAFDLYSEEKWDQDKKTFLVSLTDQNTVFDQVILIDKLELFGDVQYTFVIQNYIPQIADATTITLALGGVPVFGPYTIGYNPSGPIVIIPTPPAVFLFEGRNQTIVAVEDDLSLSGTNGIVFEAVNYEIILDNVWKTAESDEAFSILEGVKDKNATYNARYNIKNMLMANSPLLNAAYEWKNPTDIYDLTEFENSAELRTKFNIGEEYSTLDPDQIDITQSEDIQVQLVNRGFSLITPEKLSFEVRLSFSLIMLIRSAFDNTGPESIRYGYISVLAYDGVLYKGFIRKMSYNPITEMVKFTLIRKKD